MIYSRMGLAKPELTECVSFPCRRSESPGECFKSAGVIPDSDVLI